MLLARLVIVPLYFLPVAILHFLYAACLRAAQDQNTMGRYIQAQLSNMEGGGGKGNDFMNCAASESGFIITHGTWVLLLAFFIFIYDQTASLFF